MHITKIQIVSALAFCLGILALLAACTNNKAPVQNSKVTHNTLLVANAGQVYSYNLDDNKLNWENTSRFDTSGNRNYFVVDEQQIFMPFESGLFKSFDLVTGNTLWKQQIYGNEEGGLDMVSGDEEQQDFYDNLKPLFMARPLVDGENVLITSTGQPTRSYGYLYNFNKKNGNKNWIGELETVFNIFTPVKYRDNYFVNSAVFLQMFTPEPGTPTSYGMFDGALEIAGEENNTPPERNIFDKPIYCQMQTDGKSLFIGDDSGNFYCFQLNKEAVSAGEMDDPKNTFKNPKVFKWTFSDQEYDFQRDGITFLKGNVLLVEMKTGLADKSCIFALNTSDGKVKWKKEIADDILNWALQGDKIVGHTKNNIFWIDANGKNYTAVKSLSLPLSNIERMNDGKLIYTTAKGIEIFNTETKNAKLVFKKPTVENQHNNFQVKFLKK